MDPKKYLSYIQSRYKTYSYLKQELSGCDKDTYQKHADELFEEIFTDEKIHYQYVMKNSHLPVIEKAYKELMDYSNSVLTFYSLCKTIKGF